MRIATLFVLIITVLLSCQNRNGQTNQEGASKALTLQDSIQLLTDRIENGGGDFAIYKRRAELYMESGKIDPALRDVNAALELDRENPEIYILLGDIYFIIGQPDNSLNAYKKAYELDENNVQPLLSLAEAYLMLQDYELAERYLERASSIQVNQPETYYLKGVLSLEKGDTLDALTNLKIAGNIDSSYYDAFMQTGSILSAMKDSSAVLYFRAALKASPDDERALFLYALAQQENGNYQTALGLYEELIEMYPENPYAHFNSGYIHLVVFEEFDLAIESFRKAILLDPAYVAAMYNMGRAYEAKGMFEDARRQYELALALEANYPLAIEGLNRLDQIQYSD